MLEITSSLFRCEYDQLANNWQLIHFPNALPSIPHTIQDIQLTDLDQFDCRIAEKPLTLLLRLSHTITDTLQICNIKNVVIVNSFKRSPLLYNIARQIARYARFLTSFQSSYNHFGDQGVCLLMQGNLSFIKNLVLRSAQITNAGVQLLNGFRSKYLTVLQLSNNPISNSGLKTLLSLQSMPNLQKLGVDNIKTTRDGLKLFCKIVSPLRQLSLNCVQANTEIVNVLSRSSNNELVQVKMKQKLRQDRSFGQFLFTGRVAKLRQKRGDDGQPVQRINLLCYGQLRLDPLSNSTTLAFLRYRFMKSRV